MRDKEGAQTAHLLYNTQVQQSRNLLRANLTLGIFKLDIATVWAQPGTGFALSEDYTSLMLGVNKNFIFRERLTINEKN